MKSKVQNLKFLLAMLAVAFLAGCTAPAPQPTPQPEADFNHAGEVNLFMPRQAMPGEKTIHYTTPEFHYEQTK